MTTELPKIDWDKPVETDDGVSSVKILGQMKDLNGFSRRILLTNSKGFQQLWLSDEDGTPYWTITPYDKCYTWKFRNVPPKPREFWVSLTGPLAAYKGTIHENEADARSWTKGAKVIHVREVLE